MLISALTRRGLGHIKGAWMMGNPKSPQTVAVGLTNTSTPPPSAKSIQTDYRVECPVIASSRKQRRTERRDLGAASGGRVVLSYSASRRSRINQGRWPLPNSSMPRTQGRQLSIRIQLSSGRWRQF